jgi:hypothetical protein
VTFLVPVLLAPRYFDAPAGQVSEVRVQLDPQPVALVRFGD